MGDIGPDSLLAAALHLVMMIEKYNYAIYGVEECIDIERNTNFGAVKKLRQLWNFKNAKTER